MTSRHLGPARALASAATALVLAAILTACGGDDGDTQAGAEPEPSSTSSTATDVSAPPSPADPSSSGGASQQPGEPTAPIEPTTSAAPPVPASPEADGAAEDWVVALDELVDPSVPAKLRAAHIDGGADLIAAIPELDRRIAGETLTFEVSAAEVDGNEGHGQVDVTSGGAPAGVVIGVRFARVDGTWRLTRDGACLLASLVGLACP